MTLEEFYHSCDSIQPDKHGCMTWLKAHSNYYWRVVIWDRKQWRTSKQFTVHRLALERKLGRFIKPGYFACHMCDWKPCVNPDHLYEGTRKDNGKDRKARNQESWNWVRSPEGRENMKRAQKIKWQKKRVITI